VNKIMKWVGGVATALGLATSAQATVSFIEGFEDVAGLSGSGWTILNNSTPVGATNWFQGNVAPFAAQSGTANSYAAANYFSTSPAGGSISTWLITPTLTLFNGVNVSFWTRTDEDIDGLFSDRLNVRVSTSGSSSNVADFSSIILSVNPALTPGTGYPSEWQQYVAVLTGLPVTTTGRIAFEYNVPLTDSQGVPVLANYIGLDNVAVVPVPAQAWIVLAGMFAMTFALRSRRQTRTLNK
jgi:hypothetical protein